MFAFQKLVELRWGYKLLDFEIICMYSVCWKAKRIIIVVYGNYLVVSSLKSENGVIPKQLIPVQTEEAWHMPDILWKFQVKWMPFGMKILRDCLKRPILIRVHCSVICGWGVFIWAPIAK